MKSRRNVVAVLALLGLSCGDDTSDDGEPSPSSSVCADAFRLHEEALPLRRQLYALPCPVEQGDVVFRFDLL